MPTPLEPNCQELIKLAKTIKVVLAKAKDPELMQSISHSYKCMQTAAGRAFVLENSDAD